MADYDPESNYQYTNDDTEESDYDPTSTAPAPTSAPTLKSPTGAEQSDDGALDMGGIKKPRTVGGFVVDDEDDEGSPPPTSAIANHQSALSSAQNPSSYRSHTQTPLQAQSLAPVPSNPSASVSATPINGAAANSSLPAGRLAQDRVGMLEDRITDDPRGDMEAWKELISEYQRRSKYDEARAVYDRFFKVFPQAVSKSYSSFSIVMLIQYPGRPMGSLRQNGAGTRRVLPTRANLLPDPDEPSECPTLVCVS